MLKHVVVDSSATSWKYWCVDRNIINIIYRYDLKVCDNCKLI
jgi:hypothetical protein